jgi:drug/metabolite transporter superfamily protein YnfA
MTKNNPAEWWTALGVRISLTIWFSVSHIIQHRTRNKCFAVIGGKYIIFHMTLYATCKIMKISLLMNMAQQSKCYTKSIV